MYNGVAEKSSGETCKVLWALIRKLDFYSQLNIIASSIISKSAGWSDSYSKMKILHLSGKFIETTRNKVTTDHAIVCWVWWSFIVYSVGLNLAHSSAVLKIATCTVAFVGVCLKPELMHFWMPADMLLLLGISAKDIKDATWCFMSFGFSSFLLFLYRQGKHCANANREKTEGDFLAIRDCLSLSNYYQLKVYEIN